MAIFIDGSGKYYQADIAKDNGDAKIEHPTAHMLEYLKDTPVTMPEFGTQVHVGEVEKLAIPVVTKVVSEADLKDL